MIEKIFKLLRYSDENGEQKKGVFCDEIRGKVQESTIKLGGQFIGKAVIKVRNKEYEYQFKDGFIRIDQGEEVIIHTFESCVVGIQIIRDNEAVFRASWNGDSWHWSDYAFEDQGGYRFA
jgi:hypothetical protein